MTTQSFNSATIIALTIWETAVDVVGSARPPDRGCKKDMGFKRCPAHGSGSRQQNQNGYDWFHNNAV